MIMRKLNTKKNRLGRKVRRFPWGWPVMVITVQTMVAVVIMLKARPTKAITVP